jgi:hypothetical protein
MKKYIILSLLIALLMGTAVNAIPNSNIEKSNINRSTEQANASFTHTVFAEDCTSARCPNCPIAAEALYNIYQSGEYSFYYVELLNYENPIAKNRNLEYTFIYKGYAFPTVYFDGGYKNMVGRGSNVQATEALYKQLIEEVGQRTPKQPITMDSTVTWNGNAKLTVTLNIKNEGNFPYLGRIRSYVTEIESRWLDKSGNPYHFSFLDYAINKLVLLMPGRIKSFTGIFDGNANHGGNTYSDITSDNIMVISTISHWFPHYRIGYESGDFTQRYFARYIDQATGATPT